MEGPPNSHDTHTHAHKMLKCVACPSLLAFTTSTNEQMSCWGQHPQEEFIRNSTSNALLNWWSWSDPQYEQRIVEIEDKGFKLTGKDRLGLNSSGKFG